MSSRHQLAESAVIVQSSPLNSVIGGNTKRTTMTITMFLLLASFSNMTVPTLLPQVTAFSTFHRVTGHLHAGRKSHKRVRANEQVQILMKATSNNRVEDHCTNTIDGNTVNTNIGKSNNLENSTSTNIEISTNEEIAINMLGPNHNAQLYTTVILKIAYDGTHFRGWTAGKHSMMAKEKKNDAKNKSGNKGNSDRQPNKRRQSRRSRTLQRKGGYLNKNNGEVRSVERTLRVVLAKIYGNIQPNQIVLDACSRTDAGVHAMCLIAQLYCYANNTTNFFANEDDNGNTTSIPNTPTIPLRPTSRNDTAFLPLPFDSDLSKLVFVLNRMLPPDVRVAAAAPLPRVPLSTPMKLQSNIADNINDSIYSISEKDGVAFHPTLHTSCKTYIYKFAIGHIHDPMRSQYVWHLDGSSNRAVGMNGKKFCLERALLAASLFEDERPKDYAAFRSAFRGTEKNRVQSTLCTLWRCEILHEGRETLPSWEQPQKVIEHVRHGSRLVKCDSSSHQFSFSPQTFTVVITGDRFLYKMVRNIVGTIVAVACGHLELDVVRVAINSGRWDGGNSMELEDDLDTANDDDDYTTISNDKSHTIRRICAPGRGLVLHEVLYPDSIGFDWISG